MMYGNYKPSGIDWLGDIPESWETKRIKDVALFQGGYAFNSNDYIEDGVQLILIANLYQNKLCLDRNPTYVDENNLISIPKYIVSKNDILISLTGTLGKKDYGFAIMLDSDEKYLLNQRVGCIRVKKIISNRWFIYLMQSETFVGELLTLPKGTKQGNLSERQIFSIEIPIPNFEVQTEISQYLDTKTQAIDKKIHLLIKKADYYKELRKSIINDAVCKGLNKNVKPKESGIEWIGKIPEHWEVKRIKDAVQLNVSNIDKHEKEGEKSVLLCNYTDVYKNNFITSDLEFMISTASDAQIKRFSLKKGDLLITKDSETFDDIAVPAIVTEDLTNVVCGYHLALLRANIQISPAYLYNLFRSSLFNYNFSRQAKGITRVGLGINSINDTFLLVPPKEEQTAIANYLDEKTQKIDAIVNNIGKQIETLKELRKTLINDVVTGKIKVVNN